MPLVNKGLNTVTPGTICYSCIKLETKECPYKNKFGGSTLTFKGDPGTNTCSFYEPYPIDTFASGEEKMIKTARNLKEAQLNMELYKKIAALDAQDAKKLLNYWSKLYPKDYAKEMVSNDNETEQRHVEDKKTPEKGTFKKKKPDTYKEQKTEKDVKFFD